MKNQKYAAGTRLGCLLMAGILLFSLAGCGGSGKTSGGSDQLTVVTSLFPQYDFARQVGGEFADVTLLLAPGVEAHTYDPTYGDISKISSADLFFYTGDDMEPWAAKVIETVGDSKTLRVVNLSDSIQLIKEEDEEEDHEYDPHMWLNLQNAVTMLESVTDALCEKAPDHADAFRANANAVKEKLLQLDDEFMQTVAAAGGKSVVFGGRFAYQYFVQRYALNYRTVYDCCSTDVEPSAKTVAEITDYVRQNGIKYIYHEELSDPKVARSIAEATGAQLLEFSTGHNLSKDDFDSGVTFADIMERNLENLKKGLGE